MMFKSLQFPLTRGFVLLFIAAYVACVVGSVSPDQPEWIRFGGKVAHNRGRSSETEGADDFESLRQRAERGDVDAQFQLGVIYRDGEQGVKMDYAEALKWFTSAAEQGDSAAQSVVGAFYFSGVGGVRQDYAEALKWLIRAAEHDSDAQVMVGVFYSAGVGVQQDVAEALKWFARAAEQENSFAYIGRGILHLIGKNVRQDYAESMKMFRRAANLGNPLAPILIGGLYLDGLGVPQSYREAYIWFSIAAANVLDRAVMAAMSTALQRETKIQVPSAEALRDSVAVKLPPAALFAAQEEAIRRHAEIQSHLEKTGEAAAA